MSGKPHIFRNLLLIVLLLAVAVCAGNLVVVRNPEGRDTDFRYLPHENALLIKMWRSYACVKRIKLERHDDTLVVDDVRLSYTLIPYPFCGLFKAADKDNIYRCVKIVLPEGIRYVAYNGKATYLQSIRDDNARRISIYRSPKILEIAPKEFPLVLK